MEQILTSSGVVAQHNQVNLAAAAALILELTESQRRRLHELSAVNSNEKPPIKNLSTAQRLSSNAVSVTRDVTLPVFRSQHFKVIPQKQYFSCAAAAHLAGTWT